MSTSTLERPWPPGGDRPPVQLPMNPPPPGSRRPPPEPLQIPLSLLAALATLCTTLCLSNLFDGVLWWLVPATGAIAVAVIAGELGRRARAPWLAMPLVYLVLGWLYVIPAGSRGFDVSPRSLLIPSGQTLSDLRDLVQAGSHDIHTLTVPVPDRPGFLFLTVAGVYLIAALVDIIAVGLGRPAAAGLPLLVLLAVPSAVVERGVTLPTFLLAALAYISLLLASGRRGMIGWARLPPGGAPGLRHLTGAAGRRIGAVAIVAALAVAAVVPRYSGLARHHGGGASSDSATVIEPVVTLGQQLHSSVVQPLLTVHTTSPQYLRLTALENFDGQRFTLGSLSAGTGARVSHQLPNPAPGSTERVQATIDVMPALHQRYLPVPYQPTRVSIPGDWRLASRNFTIFSAKTDTSKAHYTVTSEVATPSIGTLRSESASQNSLPNQLVADTELPSDLPASVSDLEARQTSGLTTEYDIVAAIQAYLRGPLFTYDLNGAPSPGPNALVDFLLVDHRGYCEQFAGAMAVLVRAAGFPARVAVGFTPGGRQSDGSYVVTNHDAHSWPEVWFPQAGWVRFEPTKRDASTDPPGYSTPSTTPSDPTSPTPSATAAPSTSASAVPSQPLNRQRSEAPVTSGGGQSGGGSIGEVLGWTGGSIVAIALLLTPAFVRRRRRRQRLASGDPREIWREVTDTAFDLGFPQVPTLTPRRAIDHWLKMPAPEGRMPAGASPALLEVAGAEELSRYGPAGSRPFEDVSRVRSALSLWGRSCIAPDRLRAGLLPRSVLSDAMSWGAGQAARARTLRRPRRPVDQT